MGRTHQRRLIVKNGKRIFETAVHGVFLILGLITVACVLLITVYLVISGIPAIREIGLIPISCSAINGRPRRPSRPTVSCPSSSPAFTVRPGRSCWACPSAFSTAVYLAKVAPLAG